MPFQMYEVWGFHGNDDVHVGLLRSKVVWTCRIANVSEKNTDYILNTEVGDSLFLRHVGIYLPSPRGATTQKTIMDVSNCYARMILEVKYIVFS
jgi:hypothetical protein